MPIHEYVCRQCGEELERLQKLSDAPLTDCPQCGEPALKRKISAAGFRLAGGGWYETDFKSDGRRNLAGDQQAKAGNGDSTTDKTETAAKPDKTAKPGQTAQSGATGKPAQSGGSRADKT